MKDVNSAITSEPFEQTNKPNLIIWLLNSDERSTGCLFKFLCELILTFSFQRSFGICPHMTQDNQDQLRGKDLLVAYYEVDYHRNPKGSNYWRNRYVSLNSPQGCSFLSTEQWPKQNLNKISFVFSPSSTIF